MNLQVLEKQVEKYMRKLCEEIDNRHVGSVGNQQAADFVEEVFNQNGWKVRIEKFECMEWEASPVKLLAGQINFQAEVSPYSLSFNSTAELTAAGSLDELKSAEVGGKILLIHDELAREQMMPKNFVFYNPDSHKKIISLLEKKQPAAIITATGKNPELAGSRYPFPMFEDGDFNIPSVFMKDIEGEKLLQFKGENIRLEFDSKRIPAKGKNVLACKGDLNQNRIVVTAHLDTKKDTPGALDNGTGVAVLLGLSASLKEYGGKAGIELAVLNGEDYYACPGEMLYLKNNLESFKNIKLLVNIDGAAYKGENLAISTYECNDSIVSVVNETIKSDEKLEAGDPWYQGDHMIFVQNGVASVAITSSNFHWLCQEVTHTPEDSLDNVDYSNVARTILAIGKIVDKLAS